MSTVPVENWILKQVQDDGEACMATANRCRVALLALFLISAAPIPGLIHNDMWDGATAAQKQAMPAWLWRCLRS